ncbi:MAG: MATE family efflux transporter [Bacteroidota bacterium]|nr:MATE family efflux transporter [Bacteroidota bacterium]
MNGYFLKARDFLKAYLTEGHERSVKAKKNILASFLIKGASIGISLLLVPLTINYINSSRYGIWLTLSSIVAWLSFFDVGLTQGLRNKFAEAKARNDDEVARIYVSTTYAILAIIFFAIWVIFLVCNNYLNWPKILNVPAEMQSEISLLAVIVFTYFCLSFVLKIVSTVLLADQQPARSSLIDMLGQLVSLIFIVILVKTTEGSLLKLGIALCVSPLLILVGANLLLFRGIYSKYRPGFSKIRFIYAKDLFNLGLVFFIIQLAAIIQFQTANIIIARNFGTRDVTSYNIVYKYFSILNMIFTIFITPFWSASTEAYQKNDIGWIRNGIKKYNQVNLLLFLAGLIMLIFSDTVYRVWLGKGTVDIRFSLSLWGFLYFNVMMFGGKYVNFLNGISALRIQFISSVISPFLYIAVALLLIKYYHLGVYSLFIASVIASFNGFILAPLQYNRIIVKKSDSSIWYK